MFRTFPTSTFRQVIRAEKTHRKHRLDLASIWLSSLHMKDSDLKTHYKENMSWTEIVSLWRLVSHFKILLKQVCFFFDMEHSERSNLGVQLVRSCASMRTSGKPPVDNEHWWQSPRGCIEMVDLEKWWTITHHFESFWVILIVLVFVDCWNMLKHVETRGHGLSTHTIPHRNILYYIVLLDTSRIQ